MAKPVAPAEPQARALADPDAWEVDASPALLFRYSALTFNSHRIHYDAPYAREVEGYAGLVVQGPLQATLLFHLAKQLTGEAPRHFVYRATAPLILGAPFHVGRTGPAAFQITDASGRTTMTASTRENVAST